ncbi:MAG: tRNA (N6-isopentenyl adenosine(37)-C2)-methylthiotransferase MiaB, partial [Acidiphilium sp. 21-68-69]
AYSFKYSRRPGTPAADAADQIDEAVKDARLQELQAVLRDQQHAFNRAQVGRSFEVLFTGPGRHPGQSAGRSPYLQPVVVNDADIAPGTLHTVKIVQSNPNSLMASLIQEQIAA